MLRLPAALAFLLAAFAVPVPFLDRAGVALCGGALLALAVGRAGRAGAAYAPSLPIGAPDPLGEGGLASVERYLDSLAQAPEPRGTSQAS